MQRREYFTEYLPKLFWNDIIGSQACRTLGLSRILVTGNTRIRLGNVGVVDVLEADMRNNPCAGVAYFS